MLITFDTKASNVARVAKYIDAFDMFVFLVTGLIIPQFLNYVNDYPWSRTLWMPALYFGFILRFKLNRPKGYFYSWLNFKLRGNLYLPKFLPAKRLFSFAPQRKRVTASPFYSLHSTVTPPESHRDTHPAGAPSTSSTPS